MNSVTLYHGTSTVSAVALEEHGWRPHEWPAGPQCGNPGLLYLTTIPENALWYSQERGSDAVLEVTVEIGDLILDPEDGIRDSVEEELNPPSGPGNLATRTPLPASSFRLLPSTTKYSL